MKEKRKTRRRILNFFIIASAVALLIMACGVIAAWAYLDAYSDSKIDVSMLDMTSGGAGASKLYATVGGEAVEIEDGLYGGIKYKYVSIDECPRDLINAFVAIEDKRFFDHNGVDILRSAKAAASYMRGSRRSFGASTITQQLVKNLTGRDEYTLDRKFTEIFASLDLERCAHKEQILEAYLNVINLAEGCRGVGAAAELYFGREVSELTLAQCASIAAITNNPSVYDPLIHLENNTARAHVILYEMHAQGYIGEAEYTAALTEDIALRGRADAQVGRGGISSWYADMVAEDVIRDMCERLGYTRAQAATAVYNGGLKIYTAMNIDIQAELEKYYESASNFPPNGGLPAPQSAMMVVDRQTGDILGVVGAVGKKTGNRVQNYATDTKRPPGSAIKPLSVYAPALEMKRINWATVFDDVPVKFSVSDSGKYLPWPKNADGVWRGYTTVRDAVVNSVNTVSVRVLEQVGREQSLDFLKSKLHINSLSDKEDMTLSALALGQASHGISMRELLGGYTIFYDGVYRQPVSYYRVTDSEGRVLLQNVQTRNAVMSEENACIMTEMLRGVTADGTAKDIALCKQMGIATAGKTGTTQNNCDRWFVGYTPRLLAAVWMGYDYPSPLNSVKGNPCVRIWDEVMSVCHKAYADGIEDNTFDLADGVMKISFCKDSGLIPQSTCAEDTRNDRIAEGYFTPDNMPMSPCNRHVAGGLITAERNFPCRIYVADEECVWSNDRDDAQE